MCLTDGPWRKSSYSGRNSNCVEVARFRKSSYSAASSNDCVEVAELPQGAAMRDSKHPALGHITFPAVEWNAFLADVKADKI
ncbi:hypothetical protein HNR23_003643 [Nocardiopsis mwathae]|uniref:DUF397 domain-containing protein n=1 Tax=Nocardiopsis mwathae TaxID=1472723 RepID=A0A7X0D6Q6_9ACTN|nr:DUF397 domain-containing protein [Nocardiopsis mwathae]MBB6173583.1 hypothetical protein [Nocardiopsis mwathae]